jgi:integrase
MSVFRLKDAKARNLPWRAVVSREGHKRLIKHFPNRQEAEMWESERKKEERLKDVVEFRQAQQLRTLGASTVKNLVDEFIRDNPAIHPNNIIILNQFSRDPIAAKSLRDLTRQDANRYVAKKLKETWKPPNSNREPKPLSPRTVRRQVNIIQRVFQHAIEIKSGFEYLPNHFRGIRIAGARGGRRDRTPEGNELERILEACKKCLVPNNYYVPLAIYLAIYTGMRRAEIFNLMWSDIDDTNRRIRIRKSKTDKAMGVVNGTTIVLPAMALHLLISLLAVVFRLSGEDEGEEWEFPQLDKRIFPMTSDAFSQAWSEVLKRAGVKGLHFHDLRREANTRFIQAGLTLEERNLMLRHADNSMNAVYVGRNTLLADIQDKLDRYAFNGLTYDEAMEKGAVDFGKLCDRDGKLFVERDMVLPWKRDTPVGEA